MNIKYILTVALTIPFLYGCQSKPPIMETVYVDRVRVPDIPKHYLSGCDIPTPPSKSEYLDMDIEQREGALASYITVLMTDLGKCNIKIKSIDDIVIKFKDIYK